MDITTALRAGRFKDAVAAVDGRDPDNPALAATFAEALYGAGQCSKAFAAADRALSKSNDFVVKSRCLNTLAACERDDGRLDRSLLLSQRAMEAAIQGKSDERTAIASIELLERSCDRQGYNASLPIALKA